MKNKDIKIFVSHRIDVEAEELKNNFFIPVKCGAVFDKRKNIDIQGDNTGDNISEKRMSFCELTVLYWAWKNQKADYYGLCHYRRYFSTQKKFETVINISHAAGCLITQFLDDDAIKKYGLSEDELQKEIIGYDAVFIRPLDLSLLSFKSNYEAMSFYPDWHFMKDVDKAIEIIQKKYPQMSEVVQKYMYETIYSRLYNCFIMKDTIFNEFCSWLFDILFELEKTIDMSSYNTQQTRALAGIAERLVGIWAMWMAEQNYKINELPLLFVEHPEKIHNIKPAFKSNNIVIASNFNNNYASIFSTFLLSAIEKCSPNYNYDFIIFSKDISEISKQLLLKIIKGKSNISLRFYNPAWSLAGITKKIFHSVYSEDLYYRLVIPHMLENFNKVLVVDADMICREDLKELYNTDLTGYLAAGVKDIVHEGMICGVLPHKLDYVINYMKLKNPHDYINTGTLLFNCKSYREKYSLDYLKLFLEKHISKVEVYEQDMLNMLLDGNIKFLDSKWNSYTITNDFIKECLNKVPYLSVKFWCEGRNSSKGIIHYANSPKPWKAPQSDCADIWWQYARKSPFYEEILLRLVQANQLADNQRENIITNSDYNRDQKLKYVLMHPLYFLLKKFKYKIKKNLVIGERKSKAKQKYKNVKALLKDAKKLKKNLKKI